jgi:CDP-diacylglycerol--glycerol-3-phosphate 3-phosphatidyltransferase
MSNGTLTLSTRITLVRIALIPALVALLGADWRVAAAVVFLVAALTDFLDGYLARRWRQVTDLGNFLDTTADKLLVTGAILGLMAVGRANLWVAFVILAREIAVLGLRAVAAVAAVVISATFWGKLKFNVQVVGITLAILRPPVHLGPLWLDEWAMVVVAVVTALSAIDYFARFGDLIRGSRGAAPAAGSGGGLPEDDADGHDSVEAGR